MIEIDAGVFLDCATAEYDFTTVDAIVREARHHDAEQLNYSWGSPYFRMKFANAAELVQRFGGTIPYLDRKHITAADNMCDVCLISLADDRHTDFAGDGMQVAFKVAKAFGHKQGSKWFQSHDEDGNLNGAYAELPLFPTPVSRVRYCIGNTGDKPRPNTWAILTRGKWAATPFEQCVAYLRGSGLDPGEVDRIVYERMAHACELASDTEIYLPWYRESGPGLQAAG